MTAPTALDLARRQAWANGYGQAKSDAMRAIDEALRTVAENAGADGPTRISAMQHIRAAVRGAFNRREGKAK